MPFRLPQPPPQPGNQPRPGQPRPAQPTPARPAPAPSQATPWKNEPRPRDSGRGKAQSAKRNRGAHWQMKYAAADTPAKRAAVAFDHARSEITAAEKRNTRAGDVLWRELSAVLDTMIRRAVETPASNPTTEARRKRIGA